MAAANISCIKSFSKPNLKVELRLLKKLAQGDFYFAPEGWGINMLESNMIDSNFWNALKIKGYTVYTMPRSINNSEITLSFVEFTPPGNKNRNENIWIRIYDNPQSYMEPTISEVSYEYVRALYLADNDEPV